MEIIIVLLPLAILLALFFIGVFIWTTLRGQYDDLNTPQYRMLIDDKNIDPIVKKGMEE